MQELLGRISRLDPTASLGLRVIACFDELVVGNVNTRALLSAAASLAGCVAGFAQERPARTMRVTPRGELATAAADLAGAPGVPGVPDVPSPRTVAPASDGLTVWLERTGEPGVNDAIILERLALAVRIRHGRARRDLDNRRDLGRIVDQTVPVDDRRTAAAALGLGARARYRMVVAPLFAVWTRHPTGPEDVVPAQVGPIHAVVVGEADAADVMASPCGIGVATTVEHLHHSFRTALVALRLCDGPTGPLVTADQYAGLIDLLADAPEDSHQPDVDLVEQIALHPWGPATLDAVVRCGSVRQAARLAGVHHSTLQTRLETVTATLGFDPFDGFGRARIGIAYLTWRLRRSRVLDLPAPTYVSGRSSVTG